MTVVFKVMGIEGDAIGFEWILQKSRQPIHNITAGFACP